MSKNVFDILGGEESMGKGLRRPCASGHDAASQWTRDARQGLHTIRHSELTPVDKGCPAGRAQRRILQHDTGNLTTEADGGYDDTTRLAIQALARRAIELAKVELKDMEQASKEDPVAYDSMTNGGTEIGVQRIRRLLRTSKLCLEQRLDKQIPVDHPMIAWLMEHAQLLLIAVVRGADGLTAWKRIRGRAFGQPLDGIGESILYKHPAKGRHHDPQGNVGPQGGEGVFVGFNRTNHTSTISLESGQLVAARSVTRRPDRERWNADALARARTVPTDGKVRQERARVKFQDVGVDRGLTAEAAAPRPAREMRIDRKDLEEHGYDSSCPQCKHILKYGKAQRGQTHSAHCRTGILEAMSKTESGQRRIEANDERINRAMAEQVEHGDRQVGAPAVAGGDGNDLAPAHRGSLERPREPDNLPGPSQPPRETLE